MSKLTLLERAVDILSDPTRWTNRVMARDKGGNEVQPSSAQACQWCVLGALYKAAQEEREKLTGSAMLDVASTTQAVIVDLWSRVGRVPQWNDSGITHDELIATLRDVLSKMREEA